MANTIAAGNSNHYSFNAQRDIQRDVQFMAKELEKFKTPGGVQVQLYPIIDSTALTAEVEHTFKVGKQAVFNQPTVPVQEGIILIAQRLGHSVQFSAVLHKHTNFLQSDLFDPSNFLNEHYSNAAGVAINAAIRPANAALAHHQCLKHMLNAGTSAQTRPDTIHFLTVDITIQKDGKALQITQSVILPKGQHTVTRPNGSVHVTRGYVGDNSVVMLAIAFKYFIMGPQGFDVPYTMDAPLFGQTRSTLNPDDLLLIV